MKKQIQHLPRKDDTDQSNEPSSSKSDGVVNCHLKLTPNADRQLVKVQQLLRKENIKLSKTGIINLLLENLKTDFFIDDLSNILGNRLQNKIAQVFLNSDMNDHDLEILKKMERKNKKNN